MTQRIVRFLLISVAIYWSDFVVGQSIVLHYNIRPPLIETKGGWAAAGSIDTDLSFHSFLELYRT